MKKHSSEEAYYERIKQLADVNKTSIKESQNRILGDLIDYKRAADGVAYGIVKENHHYYIKKGGLNENLTIADFAYIGGLANITEFQYKKLSEAEKQRNMLLHTINETYSTKVSKTGSKKKMLTEDKAGEEIEAAASKVDDLETATDAANIAPEGEAEMEAGLEAMPDNTEPAPEGDAEIDAGVDNVETGIEDLDTGADEIEAGAEDMEATGEEPVAGGEEEVAIEDPANETTREIEKNLGKLTNTLRKTELTDIQIKSYVNSFLSAFKDKFPDIDIEDRKKMAEKITKVVPPEDIENLEQTVEITDGDETNEGKCNECGGFAQYAESRGYNAESIQECGEEEMTNLISGYANAHDEGMNDGDFKAIALFISPEIIEKLKTEYGHDEFANQVEPFSTEMNECGYEEKQAQINELFGGLKNLANTAGQKIAQKAQQVKQTYHAGELGGEVKKVEKVAADLGAQINSLNKRMQKAGGQPINVGSILTTIKNQVAGGSGVNLGRYSSVQEEGIPVDHTEVQPMEEEVDIDNLDVNDENGEENNEIGAGFEPMGGGVIKPDGASTTTIDIEKGNVHVSLNETDNKPSAGLSKEKKSDVVKAAKKGEDIGKKGKGFKEVEKAAEKGGAKDPKAVAAAAMWKNIKRESKEEEKPVMTESEQKLRLYVRKKIEELAGIRKPNLNESVKSEKLKKLDRIIEKQFNDYGSQKK